MSGRQSRQQTPPTNPFERIASTEAPCDDPWQAGAADSFADANSGLIDELEQILRGEAEAAVEPPIEPEPLFPLAEPEPPAPELDPEPEPQAETEEAFAFDTYDDDLSTDLPPELFDDPDDDFGPPQTRYGSPEAPFWEGAEAVEDEPERLRADEARLVRPRDLAIIILLVALIASGATYSAIQFTRAPVVVATADEVDPTAVAESADELAVANAGVDLAADEPEANLPEPVLVEAENAPPLDDNIALAANDPVVGEAAPEPIAAGEAALPAGVTPDPAAPIEAAPATSAPNAIAAEAAQEPSMMAFADAGGPFVPDPLDTLSGIPRGGVVNPSADGNANAGSEPTTPAIANSYVNMRSGPDNGAAVITVVAEGAEVAVIECNFWCRVIVDGQEGWIYQDFLNLR